MQKSNRLVGCPSVSLLIAGFLTSQQASINNASNLKDVEVSFDEVFIDKDIDP